MAKEFKDRASFMFTGLIHSIGRVRWQDKGLAIAAPELTCSLSLGDSVAVDGVCLTVKDLFKDGFFADTSEETLNRTTLARKAETGSYVNLEPALRLSDRLAGHLVSGHVDGLGEVISVQKVSHSWRLEIQWKNSQFGRYICEKGSIALDGISLTIGGFSSNGSSFWIAVIPHTWEITSLKYLKVGSIVNLEADLMAKYAEALLRRNGRDGLEENSNLPAITKDWLADNGWN